MYTMTFANRTADADKLQQEINQRRPLKGQALKQLREYLRIKLTWASNALEKCRGRKNVGVWP